jgi:hypothetical protein
MVQGASCIFLHFVQNWSYINRYRHWNNSIQKNVSLRHSVHFAYLTLTLCSPSPHFTITNPHIFLTFSCSCCQWLTDGCSTAIDISSHRRKLKMCICIIRNVIFFDLEYLQDVWSTEPILEQGPVKPINPGLSQKIRKNGFWKCYRERIAMKNQEVSAWTWLLASIKCQV